MHHKILHYRDGEERYNVEYDKCINWNVLTSSFDLERCGGGLVMAGGL